MQKKRLEAFKDTLLAQRRSILGQTLNNRGALAVPTEGATGDAADAASTNDVKEMTLNVKESEKRSLEAVENALAKIAEGTYGVCEECGADIPEKRLLAIPAARHCVACQEKLERGES